ncbi:SPOR domain-containing protein [Acetobacter suratthaniensis]|uniref:SPOR domain-containing protein n=1 Tax=Acetobacter suratthaniensis TaxID=1502841 RepID=A0ABS3LL56_9PROT|nr:SPOR domain-containing protein [Acetobacter suratthaniensis]MBO1327838.1 SPOR domain-containing protein [Acetobacter suratthaniensis]MCX2565982.1 SPOR domain-containing protein [Acetobacter suratthaniensis]
MNEKERGTASADDRISRARERMSTDYDDTPTKPEAALLGSMLARVTGTDSITRWLAYGAAGLGGLLVLGIGGWALVRHHSHGIPVLGPPSVAMKTHPVDPGGMQLDALGPTEETDDQTGHPVPAPEKPNPAALAAQYGSPTATPPAGAGAGAGETSPAGAAPAATQTAEAAPTAPAGAVSGAASGAADEEETDNTAPGSVEEGDSAAAGQASAQPGKPDATAHAAPPAAQPVKSAEETPARNTTAPAPAAPPAVAAKPAEAPLPAPVAAVQASKGGSGGYQVQLAALQSDAEARKEWSRLKTRYPTLFGTRTPSIVRTEQNSAVFYRLRVAGFESSADAHTFCATARERGLACMVARP